MFDLIDFLKKEFPRFKWSKRVKYFIANNPTVPIMIDSKGSYLSSSDTALLFVKDIERKDVQLALTIKLQEHKIKELETKIKISSDEVKVKQISLESQHFNIYGVKNMEELGLKIAQEINNSKIVPTNTLIGSRGSVFKEFVYAIAYKYSFNSIKTNISIIRRVLSENIEDKEKLEVAYNEFKFSNIIYDVMNNKSANIKEKNINDTLSTIHIKTLENFIEKSKEFLNLDITRSNKREAFTHLAVAVTLSTGLRLTDWLSQSQITKIGDYKIFVKGMGKKRESTKIDTKEVPTLLLNADTIILYVNKLRSMLHKSTRTKKAKDKEAHQLVDYDLVDPALWVKSSKFSYVRALYAVTAERIYNQLCIDETLSISQEAYFIKILGHEVSTDSYKHYYKTKVLLNGFDLKSYHKKTISAMI